MFRSVAFGFLVLLSTTAIAQTREQSPYLACGADVAQEQASSSKSIKEIQAIAEGKCAPLLERNVKNSYAAMERENGAIPPQHRAHVTQTLRQKLRNALLKIIEMNVPVLRQAGGR